MGLYDGIEADELAIDFLAIHERLGDKLLKDVIALITIAFRFSITTGYLFKLIVGNLDSPNRLNRKHLFRALAGLHLSDDFRRS